MSKQIDVDTLRTWLDEGRAVTVLDVRNDDARAQWAIPDSLHVDAYEELREGRPGALADVEIPHDRLVVTVCNAGRVSQTAAAILSGRGLDAHSLAGGMKAWSLAWNTASVPLTDTSTQVVQVRRTGKGCLSYLVGSEDEAAVIDPSLPAEIYAHLASQYRCRIRYVLETHIHADHLSRARALSQRTGATLLLPQQRRVRFDFTPLGDGARVTVGRATIGVHHTPGHTDESMCYLLDDRVLFTGDTLFARSVGRPDLHAGAAGARQRARVLFASLTKLRTLEPSVIVLPAHASEPIPFDGRPVAAAISTIDAWLSAWLVSETDFVDRVVSRLPETPPNFARIIELNESGELPDGDPTELEAGANRCAVA